MYKVIPHGASFKAERQPFVQGGNNFRPVGMCVAPDGSLYVTDWVKSDYTLHGKGAIWHIRWKDAPKAERPTDPKKAIFSMHRPCAAAAKKLANENGRAFRGQLGDENPRVRAKILDSSSFKTNSINLEKIAKLACGNSQMTVRTQDQRRSDDRSTPGAVAKFTLLENKSNPCSFVLQVEDPFIRHAAFHSREPGSVGDFDASTMRIQLGSLVA
jgi:hypothetical protein